MVVIPPSFLQNQLSLTLDADQTWMSLFLISTQAIYSGLKSVHSFVKSVASFTLFC